MSYYIIADSVLRNKFSAGREYLIEESDILATMFEWFDDFTQEEINEQYYKVLELFTDLKAKISSQN